VACFAGRPKLLAFNGTFRVRPFLSNLSMFIHFHPFCSFPLRMAGSSCSWLLLIVVLTLKINWELCVQQLGDTPCSNRRGMLRFHPVSG
jgi:hypothetical protein